MSSSEYTFLIQVALPGATSECKHIPRDKLTVEAVNNVFHCSAFALQERGTGDVLLPDEWQTQCLPEPAYYIIREKRFEKLQKDAAEDIRYRGTTQVLALGVPDAVTADGLLKWLHKGLDIEDPEAQFLAKELRSTQETIESTQSVIEQLAKRQTELRDSGSTAALAANEKRQQQVVRRLMALEQLHSSLSTRLEELQRDRWDRVDARIELQKLETEFPLRLATWHIEFPDTERGRTLAFIATHKREWADVRLAQPLAAFSGAWRPTMGMMTFPCSLLHHLHNWSGWGCPVQS